MNNTTDSIPIKKHLSEHLDRIALWQRNAGIALACLFGLIFAVAFVVRLFQGNLAGIVEGLMASLPTVIFVPIFFYGMSVYKRKSDQALIDNGSPMQAKLKHTPVDTVTPMIKPILGVLPLLALERLGKQVPLRQIQFTLEIDGKQKSFWHHIFEDEKLYEDDEKQILVVLETSGTFPKCRAVTHTSN